MTEVLLGVLGAVVGGAILAYSLTPPKKGASIPVVEPVGPIECLQDRCDTCSCQACQDSHGVDG